MGISFDGYRGAVYTPGIFILEVGPRGYARNFFREPLTDGRSSVLQEIYINDYNMP